jgi:hypothetical protein
MLFEIAGLLVPLFKQQATGISATTTTTAIAAAVANKIGIVHESRYPTKDDLDSSVWLGGVLY